MPNIANAIRDEITRISRRETKRQTAVLQRASAGYRRDLARLKREVAELSRQLKQASRASRAPSVPAANPSIKHRFVATGFRALRHRLGLSAKQMGQLLSVSEQSIYNWETKVTVPRAAHLPAISRLRGLGKREAQRLLEKDGVPSKPQQARPSKKGTAFARKRHKP